MIAGSLSKLGELHTISLRLVDVETSEVLDMQSVRCHCPIEEIAESSLAEAAMALANMDVEYRNRFVKKEYETYDGPLSEMMFVQVPGGSYLMGSAQGAEDEKPIHRVTISPFQILTTEFTQEMCEEIMGENPSQFKGRKRPLDSVSWQSANKIIKALNKYDPGKHYRLPTEAEWEYACKTGKDEDSENYQLPPLEEIAWYAGNSLETTHLVASKEPNEWGLYDMIGNVWEWCQDVYDPSYYKKSEVVDPVRSGSESLNHVCRGGAWNNKAGGCRPENRNSIKPRKKYASIGFRLVRDVQ